MVVHAGAIPSHIVPHLTWRQESQRERISTGIDEVNSVIEGCPRGGITEITGPLSSGRTTLLHSILAEAARLGDWCAIVDATNALDPTSAAAAGVDLSRMVWIRCDGDASRAMKAADLLIHAGGFGIIALDLCDVEPQVTRRIPLSWWFRFRRAIENTPCVLIVLGREPNAKACASLLVEMQREAALFKGANGFQRLDRARFQVTAQKPPRPTAAFEARALE
jgi:recombination protein RecA